MNTASFATADELAQYVTDQSIPQANIVSIHDKDGRWWLFWTTP